MADAAHKVYKFTLPNAGPFINGATGAIVVAPNATDALALVQQNNHWATDAQWAAATLVDVSAAEDAEGFKMVVNVGTWTATVTGLAAANLTSLVALSATAIAAAGTLSGVSAATNVLTLSTAANAGLLTISASILNEGDIHLTGFDPAISNVGGSAAVARTITFPTLPQWPIVVPIKEALAIPTTLG